MVDQSEQDASRPAATAREACSRLAAVGIRSGQMRPRESRPVKNGRFYVVGAAPPVAAKCGSGDLSMADLRAAGPALGPGWAFVVLPENPPGGVHLHPKGDAADRGTWCWYDQPDHFAPRLSDLVNAATYAVLDRELVVVDHVGSRNRAGNLYLSPGYRYTRTRRVIRAAKVRLAAVTPAELADRLTALVSADLTALDVDPGYGPALP